MKKAIIIAALLLLITQLSAQKKVPENHSKDYYLENSKRYRQNAWILTSTGTAAIIIGAASFERNFNLNDAYDSSTELGILIGAGIAADVAGLIYFVKASNYRRFASSVSVGYQQIPLVKQDYLESFPIPSLKLKLNF